MYVKVIDGTPEEYAIWKLRKDNPRTSFPKDVTEEILNEYGVYSVTIEDKPSYDPELETVSKSPVHFDGFVYKQGWSVNKLPAEEVAVRKRSYLIEQFKSRYQEPVTDAQGRTWRGGEESAAKIYNGIVMLEFVGATTIDLRDANREPHTLSMTEARTVAATIGADYQVKFQAEEEALRQLGLIDLAAPDAVAQISAITIEQFLP